MWKLLLHPRCGAFYEDTRRMYKQIRWTNVAPWSWHNSTAMAIPKANGKDGIPGQRIIHLLDPFGRAVFDVLWAKGCHESAEFAYGCFQGKSRLPAILQQRVLHERLATAGRSYKFTKNDVKNAHPSISHNALCQEIRETCPKDTWDLLEQRILNARMTFCSGEGQSATFALGAGTMPGDTIAPLMFCQGFNRTIAKALPHCGDEPDESLKHVVEPLTSRSVDVSTAVYADDLTRTDIVDEVDQACESQGRIDSIYSECLEPIGLQMHSGKRQIMFSFVGRNALHRYQHIVATDFPLQSSITFAIEFLGAHFSYNRSFNKEIKTRLNSAQRAWFTLQRILRQPLLSIRKRMQIYKSTVCSALIAGQEVSLYNKRQIKQLESWNMKHIKQIAASRFHLRDRNYHWPSNNIIREVLNIPTVESLLRLRRLQLVRHLAINQEHYTIVRAALFGKLGTKPREQALNPDGTLTQYAPQWLKLIEQDYRYLVELCSNFPSLDNFSVLTLFSPESPLIFHPKRLNAVLTSMSEASSTAHATPELPTDCSCVICGREFASDRAVVCHTRRAHGITRPLTWAVVANQCPLCEQLFSNKLGVREHLNRRILTATRSCPQRIRHPAYVLQRVCNISCTHCQQLFERLETYNLHVRQIVEAEGQ